MLGLGHAPCRGHEQRKTEIGGGFGQHIGRVRALHASGVHRIHIEIVEAHRHVGHHPQVWAGRQQRGVDALAAGRQHAILVGQPARQLGRRQDLVLLVGFDIQCSTQALQHLGKHGPGDKNAGALHQNHMNVITTNSGTRMPPDHSM